MYFPLNNNHFRRVKSPGSFRHIDWLKVTDDKKDFSAFLFSVRQSKLLVLQLTEYNNSEDFNPQ